MKKSLAVLTCFYLLSNAAHADSWSETVTTTTGGSQFSVTIGEPETRVVYPAESGYTVTTSSRPRKHHHHRLLKPTWVQMFKGQALPRDVVVGGDQPQGNEALFICRANYHGGVHPGKVHQGTCHFGWGGREILSDQYEVLVSQEPLRFVPGSYGSKPPRAVVGGYQHDGSLYICRAQYEGGMHPGKLYKGNCNIGWGGDEIAIPYYEVLTRY